MSLLSKATSGVDPRPVRALIYAPEGIGKTTFAAGAPNPIFIDVEDGSHVFDVTRFPVPKKMSDIFQAVDELLEQQHQFKTLVIDTVDAFERLVWDHVCDKEGVSNIEGIPYGKGYNAAAVEFNRLKAGLERLQTEKGMHLILLGHTNIRLVKDPQLMDHDQNTLRIHRTSAALLKEWVNLFGFASADAMVVKDDTSDRVRVAYTGRRVLSFERTKGYEAKTRYRGMGKMPLDWDEFYKRYEAAYTDSVKTLREQALAAFEQLPESVKEDIGAKIKETVVSEKDEKKLQKCLMRINELIAKGE